MTIAELPFSAIGLIGMASFLIAAFCLLGLVRAFVMKASLLFRVMYAGALMMSSMLMLGYESACVQINSGTQHSWITANALSMPAWLIFPALIALGAFAAWVWIGTERQLRASLTPMSLQEGLDSLPDGISFSTEDGIPLLVNRKMQEISDAALGTGVLDMKRMLQSLEAGDLLPGCRTEKQGNAVLLQLPDGSVWDIQHRKLFIRETAVVECIAYDMTEQYRKSLEMEKRNAHLSAVNDKIREYSQNMDEIIREREILAAKIRIHDDVGRSLLALRAYLTHPDDDRKGLAERWRFTISALKRGEFSKDTGDRMEALAEAAEAVGVRLVFDGEIPKEQSALEIAAAAIHECLTNAVKHADGTELTIRTRRDGENTFFELENNGKPPETEIQEKGGLSTLRAMVEQHHGRMEIQSCPVFLLRIQL